MTREEAEKYAENMTYREAIHNLKQAKSVPYRKATFIKVNELLNELEQEPVIDKIRAEVKELGVYYDNDSFSGNRDAMFKCNEVLQILYKYKEENNLPVCEDVIHGDFMGVMDKEQTL